MYGVETMRIAVKLIWLCGPLMVKSVCGTLAKSQQCTTRFGRPPLSTATSANGTSGKSPLCLEVSQYVWCKGVREVDVEERLRVHDCLLDVAWFCMRKLMGSLAGEMNVSFVMVVGACASALEDKRVCVEVVWVVSPACITSSRHVC
jgi:hypothetical protein